MKLEGRILPYLVPELSVTLSFFFFLPQSSFPMLLFPGNSCCLCLLDYFLFDIQNAVHAMSNGDSGIVPTVAVPVNGPSRPQQQCPQEWSFETGEASQNKLHFLCKFTSRWFDDLKDLGTNEFYLISEQNK